MKPILRFPVVALVLLSTLGLPEPATADTTSSFDAPVGVVLLVMAVAVADVTTLVGNTERIATGEGSQGMGCLGIVAGGLTTLAGLAATSEGENHAGTLAVAAGGAVVATMGIWSLRVAGRHADQPASAAWRIAPEFRLDTDSSLEPQVTATIRF